MASTNGYYFRSRCGAMFAIDPKFLPDIEASIVSIRKTLQQQKDAGNYLAYMSVPFSSIGGGNRPTNKAMAEKVAKQIVEDFGNRMWNIVAALNAEREIGDSIAVYFNGMPVEPGDYLSSVTAGNEMGVLRGISIVYEGQ